MANFGSTTSQLELRDDHHQGRGDGTVGTNMESMLSSDLQDWLRITNWHDAKFREKELGDYRQDKQKTDVGTSDKLDKKNELILPAPTESSKDLVVRRRDYGGPQRPRARSISPMDSYRTKYTDYRGREYPQTRDFPHDRLRADARVSLGHRRHLTDPSAHIAASSFGSGHYAPYPSELDDRDLAREMGSRRPPKPFEVGDRGKVRFFVMRSGSWNNLYKAMEDGVWATNVTKADMLGEALSKGITVVLFFAVNHSHGFQGYAIMKSAPSKDVHHPDWWYNVKWQISEPFEVEWIAMEHVETSRVTHILNSLNYDLPVTRSANGQELSYAAGLQMVGIINACARDSFKRAERIR